MTAKLWNALVPSKRCDWIDLLRGWAVIIMIEAHCVNAWLRHDLMFHWLQFLNGLVAPSFIMCAGYSHAISSFNHDDSIRPFRPTAKRIAIIFLCAYLLHAPSLSFKKWSVTIIQQDAMFIVDVLQCIACSMLILNGLLRIVRRPIFYALSTICLAIGVAIIAPDLWQPNVADGLWLPIRGFINGNTDRGITSLFPLVPWFSFAAFGAALGVFYRQQRILANAEQTKWSEAQWLLALLAVGITLATWGDHCAQTWLLNKHWPQSEQYRLYNMTLPSILQRLGIVFIIGSALGYIELKRKLLIHRIIRIASHESLLIYLLHMKIIFGFLLVEQVRALTKWHHYSLGWTATIAITTIIIAINIMTSLWWHQIRKNQFTVQKMQKVVLIAFVIWLFGIDTLMLLVQLLTYAITTNIK